MSKSRPFRIWFDSWKRAIAYSIIVAAAAFIGTTFLPEEIYRSGVFIAVGIGTGFILFVRLVLPVKTHDGHHEFILWMRLMYVVAGFYGLTTAPLVQDALDSQKAALIVMPCSLMIFSVIGQVIMNFVVWKKSPHKW